MISTSYDSARSYFGARIMFSFDRPRTSSKGDLPRTYDGPVTLVCPSQGDNAKYLPCKTRTRASTLTKHDTHYHHQQWKIGYMATRNHSLVYYFLSFSHSRPYPHPTIDFVTIPLITSLHFHKESELVGTWINIIRSGRIG